MKYSFHFIFLCCAIFVSNMALAKWKCEASITDSYGKIFQKKNASFQRLEELEFRFPTDPDVTGEEVIIFVNNSFLHMFDTSLYISDSFPKIQAMKYFSKGWVSLVCRN